MPVGTQQMLTVFYDNKPAIANKSTPGVHNDAISGRIHRLIGMTTDINSPFTTGIWLEFTQHTAPGRPHPRPVKVLLTPGGGTGFGAGTLACGAIDRGAGTATGLDATTGLLCLNGATVTPLLRVAGRTRKR